MVCNHCGAENNPDSRFCAGCGADLMEQAQQQQQMYNQPTYQQPTYQQPMYPQTALADPGRGYAIASLVLGIVSFLCLPAVTGVMGIIFGFVARKKGSKSPMAIAGIICGILGVVLWIAMLVLGFGLSSLSLDALQSSI